MACDNGIFPGFFMGFFMAYSWAGKKPWFAVDVTSQNSLLISIDPLQKNGDVPIPAFVLQLLNSQSVPIFCAEYIYKSAFPKFWLKACVVVFETLRTQNIKSHHESYIYIHRTCSYIFKKGPLNVFEAPKESILH